MADHAGESGWLALCDCQWPLALCQWASGFGGAGLRGPPSSESSGVVFLLVGVPAHVPALCPVHLSVPAHWQWQRRRRARCGGSRDPRIWRRRQRQWRRSVGRRLLGSQRGCVITVFQNQVPNSKGRAVIHSEELPPESQANYRPSHRPITARAPGPTLWSAGVAGYNPGPGRLKFELPSASPTASAVSALPRDACAGSAPWPPA